MFHSLKNQTVFSAFIGLLNVKYTHSYADKLYHEHPYKYTLFGLSKMLSEYQIENAELRMSNKEEGIKTLEAPFVAHTGDEFVTVFKKDVHLIDCAYRYPKLHHSLNVFMVVMM